MPPSTIAPPSKTHPVKTEPRFTREQMQDAVNRASNHVRAKYDAALTTAENQKHWANADALSVNFANNPGTRRTLRNRGRHERSNNSYAKGIVSTLANDLIGTGPRRQVLTDNPSWNRQIERAFADWTEEIDLANKLRTMHSGRIDSGEGFLVFVNNPGLTGQVQLDLNGDVEPEQVTSYLTYNERHVDGIQFDKYGNPETYYILPYHPGGSFSLVNIADPKKVPAADVLHWFRRERPGQARGIPDLTPALPLFAQLRRYTLAVIMAAEIAAELNVFIESMLPPGTTPQDLADAKAWESIDVVRGMMNVMPFGYKANAFHAEQPTGTYGDFVDKILREILNCLEMPFGLGVGDFSGSNYSSGRLDVQRYQRKVKNERASMNRLLNRIWFRWLEEAMWIPGLLPAGLPPFRQIPGAWNWDGFDYVDPVKEAQAIDLGLRNFSVTLPDVYAARGQDWTDAFPKIAAAQKMARDLGLETPGAATPIVDQQTNADTTNADSQEVANVA